MVLYRQISSVAHVQRDEVYHVIRWFQLHPILPKNLCHHTYSRTTSYVCSLASLSCPLFCIVVHLAGALRLGLNELLAHLQHHSARVRRDALRGLKELCSEHPGVLSATGPDFIAESG